MDISVLASVGSFVVSERVLKPKASVLVLLGCVLAYDLTTKTHDSSSLRVYRGPGLLAFSLMMVAYSLRTWRRNGIACDELLFLPGTPHGESTITTTTSTTGTNTVGVGDGSTVLSGSHNNEHGGNGNGSNSHPSSPRHNHHNNANTNHHQHHQQHANTTAVPMRQSEGDVAAGGSWVNNNSNHNNNNHHHHHAVSSSPEQQQHQQQQQPPSDMNTTTTGSTVQSLFLPTQPQRSFSQRSASRARSLSHDSSLSSIHEFVNNWEDDDVMMNTTATAANNNNNEDNENIIIANTDAVHRRQLLSDTNHHRENNNRNHNDEDDDNDDTNLMMPLATAGSNGGGDDDVRHNNNNATSPSNNMLQLSHNNNSTDSLNQYPNNNSNNNSNNTRVERFRDNHPNVTRIGSIFFFRSSTTSTHNAAYAPSGPSVVGAAIDLSMPVLFNFHLFIEAWNHMDSSTSNMSTNTNDDDATAAATATSGDGSSSSNSNSGEASAKILPLIFLSVLIVRTFFPPGRRGRFWSTMKMTACAPFYRSRFRDCYIGDILTSLVRPLQDVIFALAYYVTVIGGSITSKYNLSESGLILERSWILHNVVLPTIALLPLWWKFLQSLRESYDTGKRWPYLGNAFKYLSAAMVILYGMTHREDLRSTWWIVAFAVTLVYQIFWDTVMDWDLFVIVPKETCCDTNSSLDISESTMWFNRPISSMRPDSYCLLSLQRHVLPIRECIRSWLVRFPSYKQIQIRPRRLYKSESFYWRIFIYNVMFRFCWMLSFIPAYHFSSSGRDVITTFSSDTHSYVGVLLPIAEILRRTLWGFLYLEIQTIKMSDGELCHTALYTNINNGNMNDPNTVSENDATIELSSLLHDSSKHGPSRFQQQQHHHHYLPAWLGMQQQLQHDAAMTLTSTQSSSTPSIASSKVILFGNWFQYTDKTRRKLFMIELSLWAFAFVGLGIWATM